MGNDTVIGNAFSRGASEYIDNSMMPFTIE